MTATHQLWVKVLQVEDLGCPEGATVTPFTVDSLGFSMDKDCRDSILMKCMCRILLYIQHLLTSNVSGTSRT